jgi:hypothetical protein
MKRMNDQHVEEDELRYIVASWVLVPNLIPYQQ